MNLQQNSKAPAQLYQNNYSARLSEDSSIIPSTLSQA